MKPLWKYLLIGLLSLGILIYLIYTLTIFSGSEKNNVCRIVNIRFVNPKEVQMISDKEIAEQLEKSDLNPMGKTIKDISTENIEKNLLRNPLIKSAECYKTPSGVVNIDVQQRIPVFRVVGDQNYYVDNERRTMPVSSKYAAYVPVVSGKITTSVAYGQLYDFVVFVKNSLFWNAQIEQIFVRDDNKIELIPRVGDMIILLGTLDRYESKLRKMETFYKYGLNILGWNRYKTINLEYKDQVVCSKDELTEHTNIFVQSTDSVAKKDSLNYVKL